jgi:hypothetical protein
MTMDPWVWSKRPEDYESLNDWFTRGHSEQFRPENNAGSSDVLTPAVGVTTFCFVYCG